MRRLLRRSFIAAAFCSASLLLAVPAALALTGPAPRPCSAGHVMAQGTLLDRTPLTYESLARRILSGTGTISLNVYTYLGQPEVNARTSWLVTTDSESGSGTGITDVNGHVEMTGVAAANAANGQIAVVPSTSPSPYAAYELTNVSWGDTGWTGGLQPGRLPVTVVRSSQTGWNAWSGARIRLWAENAGGEQHLAVTDITRTSTSTSGYARTITTGPESLTKGSIYYWDNQGMELPVSGTPVTPGSQASPALTAYQSQAQRVWMEYWGSGKPGTTTWLWLNNYPDNWVNDIHGLADYPSSASMRSHGSLTTDGAKNDYKKLTIPATAAPGYAYWVAAEHRDGTLALQTWFQTCTLKPSRSTVYRGTAISLSGVVPIKGHYGSKTGRSKYVYVYKTTSATVARYQPANVGGNLRAAAWRSGIGAWTKVGRVRTDGLGRYRKGSVTVPRTTWYCVWYPGDAQYFPGWTSVLKVTAR